MSTPRPLHCADYASRPYPEVRALLRRDPLGLIQRATTSAGAQLRAAGSTLRIELGTFEVGVRLRVGVENVTDEMLSGAVPALRVSLMWKALRNPALFPSMLADLLVWPLSARQTQVEVEGAYWVPMGAVGALFEAVIGDRIASASAQGFLWDLITQIHRELPQPIYDCVPA
jgi:hypothetical protein